MNQHIPLAALEIRALTKRFDRPAVDGLDLTVRAGEFYCLLGPNGAGKTTTLRMVAGLLAPDAGVDLGVRHRRARRSGRGQADHGLGVGRADDLRQADAVRISRIRRRPVGHRAGASPRARANDLIGWLGLTPHAHERCEGFSKGMRQKVALAGALVHDPRLIILDEPLTGLDAGSARQVKNVLRERVAAGGTVIMTTHILEVAERMADRIGVIAGGRLIAEGTLDELRIKAGKRRLEPGGHVPHAGRRAGASGVSAPRRSLAFLRASRVPPGVAGLVVDADRRQARVARASSRSRWRRSRSFMHLVAFSIVAKFAEIEPDADRGTLVVITGCALLAWSLMMSQAMESVTRAFYARSDLDLILSSPVASRRVFAVRIATMAVSTVLMAVLLAAPFINILIWRGGLRWLGGLWRGGRGRRGRGRRCRSR